MFAVLGEILFTVLTSPEVMRVASKYDYAEHKLVEAPPRLQWITNDLQTVSLELGFHVAFVNPQTSMNQLRAAAEDHRARALVFGNGIHRGYFIIESIEETFQQLAGDGSYVAITARIELREWVPGADFDPSSPPRRMNPPPGTVHAPAATSPSAYSPSAPIGSTNPLPTSAILQLSSIGVPGGVTYSTARYSQPGVSSVAGSFAAARTPTLNFGDVPASVIVRAG